ncbi:RNA-dependent RNA polymerase 1 [Forsythia ovata]|uniref:RNA-dependent RNA polymerase 1 n=1 Tax=Forsythia ovata TaxID=205694 RepID=A0ABD1NZZ2_9LAMI
MEVSSISGDTTSGNSASQSVPRMPPSFLFLNFHLSTIKEAPDDQLIRTTDFTPSCIGKSSGLCLQLPHRMNLPNFADNFANYKESESQFSLETGSPFCHNSSLVPIMHPPEGIKLPCNILFKICTLVQYGCLPGPNLDANFFRLVDPQRIDVRYIEYALEKLYDLKECCYDPVSWLTEQYDKYGKMRVRWEVLYELTAFF